MKILVAYASAHGSTREVAEFMGRVLSVYNAEVTVSDVSNVLTVDGYDVYILGSAIHGGMWLYEMAAFIERFAEQLALKPSYFWITCIRALETAGLEHALKYYFDHKALQSFDVRDFAVFTGKLYTDAITRQEQWYLAASYDGQGLPGNIKHDFRNWPSIAAWANNIAKDLQLELVFDQPSAHASAAPA